MHTLRQAAGIDLSGIELEVGPMIRTRPHLSGQILHRDYEDDKGKARYSRATTLRNVGASLTAALGLLFVLTLMALALSLVPKQPQLSQSHFERSVVEESTVMDTVDDEPQARWVEAISWNPRAFMYHNFMNKEECEHLIEIAKPRLERSTIVDKHLGLRTQSRARTSSGTFIPKAHDDIVSTVEQRIANYTFMPVEHGEPLQVLQYREGEKYEPHYDYFFDSFRIATGHQRIATVLMYLSDVEEGGETVFPWAKGVGASVPESNELSECGKRGLAVRPKMGDALLFWSLNPDTTVDPLSLHGGCPVIKGNKWLATKWLHVQPVVLSVLYHSSSF